MAASGNPGPRPPARGRSIARPPQRRPARPTGGSPSAPTGRRARPPTRHRNHRARTGAPARCPTRRRPYRPRTAGGGSGRPGAGVGGGRPRCGTCAGRGWLGPRWRSATSSSCCSSPRRRRPGRRRRAAAGYLPPVDAPSPTRSGRRPRRTGPATGASSTPPRRASPCAPAQRAPSLFAGPVAGALHVTVGHPDGLRTSYSFLATAGVAVGQRVRQGEPVGTAGGRLHFGVRAGDTYLDPASLFGGAVVEVELLPTDPGPARPPPRPRRWPRSSTTWAGTRPRGRWGARSTGSGTGPPRAAAGALAAYGRGLDLAADLAGRVLAPPPCSAGPPPVQPAAGRGRVALTVAGLGSSSEQAAVDDLRVGDLGYDPDRVLRFSYAGGRTPPPGGDFPERRGPALRLRRHPGRHDRRRPGGSPTWSTRCWPPTRRPPSTSTPTRSAGWSPAWPCSTWPSAAPTWAASASSSRSGPRTAAPTWPRPSWPGTRARPGNLGLDVAGRVLDVGIDPDAPVVRQLASGSDVVDRLAAAGLPPGVRLLSISARGDLVAASPTSRVAGAANVTVPVTGWRAHSVARGLGGGHGRDVAGARRGAARLRDVVRRAGRCAGRARHLLRRGPRRHIGHGAGVTEATPRCGGVEMQQARARR